MIHQPDMLGRGEGRENPENPKNTIDSTDNQLDAPNYTKIFIWQKKQQR